MNLIYMETDLPESPTRLSLSISECSILVGESLKLILSNIDLTEYTQITYSIVQIEKDYTHWCCTSTEKLQFSNGTITINPNSVNEGFYFFGGLKFSKDNSVIAFSTNGSEIQNGELVFTPKQSGIILFEIRKSDEISHTQKELQLKKEEIEKKRQEEFNSGFGFTPSGTGVTEYQGFVFVKNCLIKTPMRLGKYEIAGIDYLPFTDEYEMVKTFFEKEMSLLIELKGGDPNGEPVFVAHFPKIFAPSLNQAFELIHQEVMLLSNLLSIHRHSYGSIFCMFLIDKTNGEGHTWLPPPTYRGNLIGGFCSGEVPQQIKDNMNKIRTNPQLQLYLALYTEALREERNDFICFRYWNLLETIARSKKYIDQPSSDLQGNRILNKRKQPILIQDKAEELVEELLKRVYRLFGSNDATLAQIIQSGEIRIWLRHRNCVAHSGGCFPNNPTHCDRTDMRFTRCKQYYDTIVAKTGKYEYFNDTYLQNLKTTVETIIRSELK